jgi:hypothetical protein
MADASFGVGHSVDNAIGSWHCRPTLTFNRDDGGAHQNGVAFCGQQLVDNAFERGGQFH